MAVDRGIGSAEHDPVPPLKLSDLESTKLLT